MEQNFRKRKDAQSCAKFFKKSYNFLLTSALTVNARNLSKFDINKDFGVVFNLKNA